MSSEEGNQTPDAPEVDPAILSEATSMGWTPQEKWKGDPARWTDAATFVERGHTVLPILRKNNERLQGELEQTKAQAAEATRIANELRTSMKSITDFQAAEVKRQVDERVAQVRAQLKVARAAGDTDLETDLEEALDVAKARQEEIKRAPAPAPTSAPPPGPRVEPWAQSFADENSDWLGPGKNARKTAMFQVIAEEIHQRDGLTKRELLDAAKAQLDLEMGTGPKTPKTEGSSGGAAGSSPNGSGGKGFASLPADAKAHAIAEEKKYVGPNKAFKTKAEWHNHFAAVYQQG